MQFRKSTLAAFVVVLMTTILVPNSSSAAVTFGREKLKATTRKMMADRLLAHKFDVEVDGMRVLGISSIGGLLESVFSYQEGGNNEGQQKIALSFNSASIASPEQFKGREILASMVYDSLMLQKVSRRSISVIFLSDSGKEEMRLIFSGSKAIQWGPDQQVSRSSGHAGEKLEITFEEIDLK